MSEAIMEYFIWVRCYDYHALRVLDSIVHLTDDCDLKAIENAIRDLFHIPPGISVRKCPIHVKVGECDAVAYKSLQEYPWHDEMVLFPCDRVSNYFSAGTPIFEITLPSPRKSERVRRSPLRYQV